jgi:bifunctional oligoribonuclease and PAP phosphatase NrnA
MTHQTTASLTDFDTALEALRTHERFLVVTHENPDGDALGSMLGAALGLRGIGKDVLMYLAGDTPFPAEYGFMALGEVLRQPPEDIGERVLLALDCANEHRIAPDPAVLGQAALVIDVDHHHDNTRFGAVNLVVAEASSTAEIVADLLDALDAPLSPRIAEALYVGVVTDTGRFQYSNTTPKALRLAADLIEAGANVHEIFRHVYETVQFAKLKLLARALEHARPLEGGRLVVSYLLRSDFADAGAQEPFSEGIIDYLRASEGSVLVALIREPPAAGGPKHRVSLRSSSDEVDVSAIARKSGGGGHVQAAGFSSELELEEIIEFVHREFVAAARPED